MACQCTLCKRNATVAEKLQALPEDQRGFWDRVYDDLLHVEMDRDVNAAVIDGSWPEADAVIAAVRARARAESGEREGE